MSYFTIALCNMQLHEITDHYTSFICVVFSQFTLCGRHGQHMGNRFVARGAGVRGGCRSCSCKDTHTIMYIIVTSRDGADTP